MKSFRLRTFNITSRKIKPGSRIRMACLADLHGSWFGHRQERILDAIRSRHPDLVLAAGDMINRKDHDSMRAAYTLLAELAGDVPVFYSPGNHESVLHWNSPDNTLRWLQSSMVNSFPVYNRRLEEAGVHLMYNKREQLDIKGCRLDIAGLELDNTYFRKPPALMHGQKKLVRCIGKANEDAFQILLAHTPRYADAYFAWKADLTLCGHYHGGVLRFTDRIGAISPYYQIFPRYCCGHFQKNGKHLFVSPGLGEHTIPIRIHNPRELYIIDVHSAEEP